jgi:uncharacterized protein YciI
LTLSPNVFSLSELNIERLFAKAFGVGRSSFTKSYSATSERLPRRRVSPKPCA